MKIQTCPIPSFAEVNDPAQPFELWGEVLGRDSISGTGWGQATCTEKITVIEAILAATTHLNNSERALLLAIARHESGFNPRAVNPYSTAHGVFQVINGTWRSLGFTAHQRQSLEHQIDAGVRLFEEHRERLPLSQYAGDSFAAQLYALHHDGPSLAHGGIEIGRKQVAPWAKKIEALL